MLTVENFTFALMNYNVSRYTILFYSPVLTFIGFIFLSHD